MFGVRMCSLPSDRIVSQRCWSVQIQRMFGLSSPASDWLAARPAPAAPTNLRRVIDASTAGRLSHAATNARAHSASCRHRVAVTSLRGAVLVRADRRFPVRRSACMPEQRAAARCGLASGAVPRDGPAWLGPARHADRQPGGAAFPRNPMRVRPGIEPGSPLREGGVYPRVKATNSSPDFVPPLPMSRPPPPAAMTTYCLPSTP